MKAQRRLDISLHTRKIVRGNSRRLVIYRDVIMGGGGLITSRWIAQIILSKESRKGQVFQTSSQGKYLTPRDYFW